MAAEPTKPIAEPTVSRLDEPVRLAATGLGPGAEAVLRVHTTDGECRAWESWARFRADAQGGVDATVMAPLEGTYEGVDPAGLLWSMRPVEPPQEAFFARRKPIPLRMSLVVESDGTEPAETQFERTFTDPDVEERTVSYHSGLSGTVYSRRGAAPGVIVVGGSDGGQQDHAAALLAARGYTVLSLGYFGVEDRPAHLHRIDLGYFLKAITWLIEQPDVTGERVAVVGLSRGGELALQLGSMDERVAAVVAGAPSSVRQCGLTTNYTDYTQPAWQLDGEALPFVPGKMTASSFFGFMRGWLLRRPIAQRPIFERALRDSAVMDSAAIEVERIAGPVLLLSGTDDRLWPSERYGELVMDRLARHDHPYTSKHRVYPGAGHFVAFPYALPSLPPSLRLSPAARMVLDFGGAPAPGAAAAEQSWQEINAFLAAAL
ncbi:acyl-CoA thioester hydrolase/BAAT C-terminal domain-containing protein [Nonomuraea sp. NPDC050404]|uniref:acyl-CoA thioesterase/bile acid-CoA:amino acid N-acyltransferase family protein n=1 Tax=Nonomuraea sp. NPDC050404 TaxID=3155783 RepID=UPI0033E0FD6B